MPSKPWRQNEGRSAASRGYDAAWAKLRAQVLAEQPACPGLDGIRCGAPATDADHIIPVSQRPDLRLVRSNVRGLCRRHHLIVTGRQGATAAGNRGRKREAEAHPGLVR